MSHLTEIIQILSETYPPAHDRSTATLELTTSQVYKAIAGFFPGDINADELFNSLIAAGYNFTPKREGDELEFVWLIGRD